MAKMKKRADGRYQQAVTNPKTNQKKYIYGKTQKEINQKIREFYEECDRVKSFNEIAREWWSENEYEFETQSRKSYSPCVKRSLEYFDQYLIDEISFKEINRFLISLKEDGKAHKTVLNQKTVLNHIFDYAVKLEEIAVNPCARASLPKNLKKGKRSSATEEEEEIVKRSADICLIPFIAIYTGMRKGEILALQWKDIDFKRNEIHVTKSVFYEGNNPKIKCPKTEAGIRIVPLLNPLKTVLLTIEDKTADKYLFTDDGIKPLTNKRYDLIYRDFRQKTGVKSSLHQLRHSFATIAFESGLDPKMIQMILGHKDVSTTLNIYTDFRQKSFDKAAEMLNQKFDL